MSINDSSNVINAKTERRTERPEDVAVLSLGAAAKFCLIQSAFSYQTKQSQPHGQVFIKLRNFQFLCQLLNHFSRRAQ